MSTLPQVERRKEREEIEKRENAARLKREERSLPEQPTLAGQS